jgi:hypothetical protein
VHVMARIECTYGHETLVSVYYKCMITSSVKGQERHSAVVWVTGDVFVLDCTVFIALLVVDTKAVV